MIENAEWWLLFPPAPCGLGGVGRVFFPWPYILGGHLIFFRYREFSQNIHKKNAFTVYFCPKPTTMAPLWWFFSKSQVVEPSHFTRWTFTFWWVSPGFTARFCRNHIWCVGPKIGQDKCAWATKQTHQIPLEAAWCLVNSPVEGHVALGCVIGTICQSQRPDRFRIVVFWSPSGLPMTN